MPMTLNDVPLATQTLAQTQPSIRGNFNTIDTAFQVDHVAYNLSNTGNQGKHNQVTFPIHLPTTPVPTFLTNEIGLFNQNSSPTLIPDIWMRRGTANAYPMTGALVATNGWSYLPSGLLIQWGTKSAGVAVTFPMSFQGAPLMVLASQTPVSSPDNTNHQIIISTTPTAGGFTAISANSTGGNFCWFAIGIPTPIT